VLFLSKILTYRIVWFIAVCARRFKKNSYEDLGYIVSTMNINSKQLVWVQSTLIYQNSIQLFNYHSVIVLKTRPLP